MTAEIKNSQTLEGSCGYLDRVTPRVYLLKVAVSQSLRLAFSPPPSPSSLLCSSFFFFSTCCTVVSVEFFLKLPSSSFLLALLALIDRAKMTSGKSSAVLSVLEVDAFNEKVMRGVVLATLYIS